MARNKSYQLGLYEKAMPSDLTWKEKLLAAKEAGFDYVEMSVDESDAKLARLDYTDEQINEIRTAIVETNVPIMTMCLSGHRKYPLGSHDEKIRTQSLDIMEKAIKLCVRIGIRTIQIAGYDVYYEDHDELTRNAFDENLGKCVQLASKHGVILGFETMETNFMNTVYKAMFYVHKFQSPFLKVYPDIGNLTNAARLSHVPIQDDLNQARGHIVAAHLKEVIEGHFREIPFGTGDTHYDAGIACLKDQGVYLLTGEFWFIGSPQWREDLTFANTYLREKIEKYYTS